MLETDLTLAAMAEALARSKDYRVLRRLVPRETAARSIGQGTKTGILLDLETTGLDQQKDEVIEIGMVKFDYLPDGRIAGIKDVFSSFNERRHPRPMIDLAIFRDPTVVGAAIAMLGYAAAAQVMMTILPLYLQDAFDQSPATAGLAMIPFALPLLIGPSIGGKLAARMSSRAILSFGLGLVALGDAIAAVAVLADLGYWTAAIGMFATGSGAGLLNSETAKAQIGSVPPERAGMASGLASTTRFIGIIAGVAGLGAVLSAVAESNLRRLGSPLVSDQTIDWHGISLRIVGGDANGALSALPETIRVVITNSVHSSVAAGFGAAFDLATVVAILSSVASWRLIQSTGQHSS